MARPVRERIAVHLRAKRALGQMRKQSASDHREFMRTCIDQLTDDGEDEDDARDICQMLWEQGSDLFD